MAIPTHWIDAVKAHAREHYNDGGWDFVVETMDNSDIAAHLSEGFPNGKPVTSASDAILAMEIMCQLLDDHRRDIQATAW